MGDVVSFRQRRDDDPPDDCFLVMLTSVSTAMQVMTKRIEEVSQDTELTIPMRLMETLKCVDDLVGVVEVSTHHLFQVHTEEAGAAVRQLDRAKFEQLQDLRNKALDEIVAAVKSLREVKH